MLQEPLTVRRPLIARFSVQHSPQSLYLAVAALLLALTLVFDILFQSSDLSDGALIGLLLLCVLFAATTLILGERLPEVAGTAAIFLFALYSAFFVSPWATEANAIASLQELPMISLYLGWFVPGRTGRVMLTVFVVLLGIAVGLNPEFAPGGSGLGMVTAVHALLIAVMCFEIGRYMWRRGERKGTTDLLTGVLNRKGFMQALEREMENHARTGEPRTLVVMDFDRFKELNDTHGHAAGDRALKETVLQWTLGLRSQDVLGRTGGDEFAVILVGADAFVADVVVRRMRQASTHAWSWGSAQFSRGETAEEVFMRADARLYAQKRSRR